MRSEVPSPVALVLKLVWWTLTLAAILSACASSQTGVATSDRTNYTTIAIVPRVNDKLLSVYWANPLAQPDVSEARMGWDAADGAGQISQDILSKAGASVAVTTSPNSAIARSAQVAIVLEQTPFNQFAQNYNPGRDLLLSGASVAGAATAGGLATIYIEGEGNFEPRSVLRMTGSEGGGTTDPDFCAVGVTPYLVNPATSATIAKGRPLMGIEKIPFQLTGRSWTSFDANERGTVLAYCQSALRRVISQSFVELGVVG